MTGRGLEAAPRAVGPEADEAAPHRDAMGSVRRPGLDPRPAAFDDFVRDETDRPGCGSRARGRRGHRFRSHVEGEEARRAEERRPRPHAHACTRTRATAWAAIPSPRPSAPRW